MINRRRVQYKEIYIILYYVPANLEGPHFLVTLRKVEYGLIEGEREWERVANIDRAARECDS